MDLGLRGRVALVTGASQGIGGAVALELAREGARVAFCGRRVETLAAAEAALRERVPEADVLALPADVTRPEQVEALVAAVAERLGQVEVLVNAVGHGVAARFPALSEDAWSEALNANLLSATRVTQRVLPAMQVAGWGRIVNVSAVSGRQPTLGQVASNAAKAALISFTKSLSAEVAEQGITVNTVLPGRILSERVLREHSAEAREQRAAAIPMKRYGAADEVAAAVVFLTSTRASYITGAALAVDGGLVTAMF